jgi:hypothetical protein
MMRTFGLAEFVDRSGDCYSAGHQHQRQQPESWALIYQLVAVKESYTEALGQRPERRINESIDVRIRVQSTPQGECPQWYRSRCVKSPPRSSYVIKFNGRGFCVAVGPVYVSAGTEVELQRAVFNAVSAAGR